MRHQAGVHCSIDESSRCSTPVTVVLEGGGASQLTRCFCDECLCIRVLLFAEAGGILC